MTGLEYEFFIFIHIIEDNATNLLIPTDIPPRAGIQVFLQHCENRCNEREEIGSAFVLTG